MSETEFSGHEALAGQPIEDDEIEEDELNTVEVYEDSLQRLGNPDAEAYNGEEWIRAYDTSEKTGEDIAQLLGTAEAAECEVTFFGDILVAKKKAEMVSPLQGEQGELPAFTSFPRADGVEIQVFDLTQTDGKGRARIFTDAVANGHKVTHTDKAVSVRIEPKPPTPQG